MKQCLIVLYFMGCALANAQEVISVYLCSRLTEEALQWNQVICEELDERFRLFRPQDLDLSAATETTFDQMVYLGDMAGMETSDILLVLPPYGRDCAWEIGWFCGQQRPAIAYIEKEGDFLRDAMVKGGLTAIITSDPVLYEHLMQDASTSKKSYLISSRKELGDCIKEYLLK